MHIKIRKKRKHKRQFLVILALLVCVAGATSYVISWKPKVPLVGAEEEKKTLYPVQYSDTHITKNAMVTDKHFASLFAFERNNLLAGLAQSIQTGRKEKTDKEKGTWLWTPVMEITPKYRDSIISGAKKAGLRNIYMSIDSYLDIFVMPDGPEKTKKKKEFDGIVEDFIAAARKNNMTVDAEGGWRNWAEPGNEYKAFAVVDYAMEFNKKNKEKFRGFQYDVEPYILPQYKKDKAEVLSNFLTLINATVTKLNRSDLEFSVVIPEFYDGENDETPAFTYAGRSGYAIDHLLSILERRIGSNIIIMSYRNFSKGDDGSIDVSEKEIAAAQKYHSKIIIAQETGNVKPNYITFHNTSFAYYQKQLETIQQTFAKNKSYGGVAVHYINSLMELE